MNRKPVSIPVSGHAVGWRKLTGVVFAKPLREKIRRGRVKCSIRIWTRPHVKVDGRYPMDDGHIVVDSIESIQLADITQDLAQESGFATVEDLLQIAKHGRGENVYLIRFHYLPPGGWDAARRSTPRDSRGGPVRN